MPSFSTENTRNVLRNQGLCTSVNTGMYLLYSTVRYGTVPTIADTGTECSNIFVADIRGPGHEGVTFPSCLKYIILLISCSI
jgi:hypothetical protein